MAKCFICQKAGQSGYNVSHSKVRTRKKWLANIQRATIYPGGVAKEVSICSRCLRTQSKSSAKV
ncbi:MAG: 50S ribosomal protein L28 [SAR202 cluster bacterium]|nr:50S ribosomal protein L28 [SAR202 cluster bacterium]